MKKVIALLLVIALTVALSVSLTMAYLQDEASDVNVMTLGNVYIEQHEYERVVDENGNWVAWNPDNTREAYSADEMQVFEQFKPAYPAVYQNGKVMWDDRNGQTGATTGHQQSWAQVGAPGSNQLFDDSVKNVIDKFVFVENTGTTAAYYRTLIAIECPEGLNPDMIHVNKNGHTLFAWENLGFINVNGVQYDLMVATYQAALAPDEVSRPSLLQVFLDPLATNDDCALFGENWEILTISQAVQAAGFEDKTPGEALDMAFGDPMDKGEDEKENAVEWFEKLEIPTQGNDSLVATMWLYDMEKQEFPGAYSLITYSEETTLRLKMYFFPEYTGTIQPVEDAYSGEEAADFANYLTYSFCDEEFNPLESVEGVTIAQDENDPSIVTVTVSNTVSESFYVKYELKHPNANMMGSHYFTDGSEFPSEDEPEMKELILSATDAWSSVTISPGEIAQIKISGEDGADLSNLWMESVETELHSGWEYDAATGILTTGDSVDPLGVRIYDNTGNYSGIVWYADGDDGSDDDDDSDWESSAVITVDGYEPDEEGYIYLRGLDIEENNRFSVVVNDSYELAEGGLTAEFHDDDIVGTKLVVDTENPYEATLTIAARDRHTVKIMATMADGTVETVTVVPIYTTLIITPSMDGETIYLTSEYYTLVAEEFTDSSVVDYELTGANRCLVVYDENRQSDMLSVSHYESGDEITLTATDGTTTSAVKIVIPDAMPYDDPLYSYYIKGEGMVWAYALVEWQNYFWEQDDSLTYELSCATVNDFAGQVNWTIEGITEDGAAGFIDDDGAIAGTTSSGKQPAGIKVTAKQKGMLTITAILTVNGETAYEHEFYVYPLPVGVEHTRHLMVRSDDEYDGIVRLGPGQETVVYVSAADADLVSSMFQWSIQPVSRTDETSKIQLTTSEDDNVVIRHLCESADACACNAAAYVVTAKFEGMDWMLTSDFEVIAQNEVSEEPGDDEYVPEITGTLAANVNLNDFDGWLDCEESITITIDGYDDMLLFTWELVAIDLDEDDELDATNVGVFPDEAMPGVYWHYGEGTEGYNTCRCKTVIKATLQSDSSKWVQIIINCA